MKKHFRHIIYFVFILQITACVKEENKPEYTISGTLRESCGSPPKAGAYLELFQDASGSGLSQSQTLHTTTDNQGRFSFTYKDQTGIPLSLYYGTPTSSTKILMGIPNEKNVELGNVYLANKSYLYIKIKCSSAHSINDTIYYAILPSAGPKTFTGQFASFTDSVYVKKGQFQGENTFNVPNEQGRFIWGIGFSDYKQALNSIVPDVADYHVGHFTYRGCGYKDTAFINIP